MGTLDNSYPSLLYRIVKAITHPETIVARADTPNRTTYRILGILGEGGSGITYRAENTETQQLVALKALSLRRMEDWKSLELFDREAAVLSQLDRRGIPKYIDYFYTDIEDDRYFYIIQELAPGKTLQKWIASGWRPTEKDIRDIAIQLLEILIYLHGRRPPIVHRDIKPSNILRDSDGKIYLVDFGAVQQTYHDTFMRGSTVVGTFGYMAPEQFRGQAVAATDLYGLGATILHLLTRRSPAEIPQDNLRLNFRDRIQVSPAFADWLERLLEPEISERFSSAIKALSVLKNPAKAKPTSFRFDRSTIGISSIIIFVILFVIFDSRKYYFLEQAGLIAVEPFQAVNSGAKTSQVEYFINRGFNPNARDKNGNNLMFYAMQKDDVETIEMLVDRGADIHGEDYLASTYLEAIRGLRDEEDKNPRKAEYVAHKIKEMKKYRMNGILGYAVRKNHPSLVKKLLEKGVKIEGLYPIGNMTLLHMAVIHEDGIIAKMLLDKGADPNALDSASCTPLHLAISPTVNSSIENLQTVTGKTNIRERKIPHETITNLIESGASKNARCGSDTISASELARDIGRDDIAELIKKLPD
jgi:serine/threonine protein kinase